MEKLFLFFTAFMIWFSFCCAIDVSYDKRAIIINGDHRVLFSGSIHYPRSTPEMWPDLIQKAKDGGLDAIETYVFWNAHEPKHRQYDFEGRNDLVRFIKTIQEGGLYAVLRIGPYVCAEWNYGGLPTWLHTMPGLKMRTDNEVFKNEMNNFTTLIVDMLKQEKLFAPQGGPIIIAQIENEYGNIAAKYEEAGKKYINWCAKLAESFNLGVPWVMCQQSDAPQPMINSCNGWYCDHFTPTNPNTPKMWTENWTGWFKAWGGDDNDPHRRAEDVAYAVARFYQTGGTFQNYYMYHGGTNFGRVTGGPYITTTYDYDAPLDEYGYPNEPKYSHLKRLHTTIKSMETILTKGDNTTEEIEDGISATIYNHNGTKGCFLSNTNDTRDATITFGGKKYFVPAWSVSILPDCSEETYNTAKVTTQTRLMVKKPGLDEKLAWTWREENIKDQLQTKGTFSAPMLKEQLSITNDASDYLWYMTSFNISESDPSYNKIMKIRVNTTGHGLHIFFNEKLVGSHYGEKKNLSFVLEAPVEVKDGLNRISLLSVTVGLANYGAFFDLSPTGIIGGPVQLVGNGNASINLSSNMWTYKTGLTSVQDGLLSDKYIASFKWTTENLPINKILTWYKTTFSAPLGLDPVVVNLLGLGKGEAWVNGHSIGRYWPKSTSSVTGCPKPCDYKGKYSPKKCSTGCGQSSQSWYHIPRSFLKADDNTLLLFEELGGNPLYISFHTVTTGTICASVPEGKTLELSCSRGHAISEVKFASYGDVAGVCGSYGLGTCHSRTSLSAVQEACIGKSSCSLEVSDINLGQSDCISGVVKNLVVEALCQ